MPLTYSRAREETQNGDAVLVERNSAISRVGRSVFSHVATIAKRPADLEGSWTESCAESMEGKGGRIIALKELVRLNPGRVWVFRPLCERAVAERAATIAYNWAIGLHGYDYHGIVDVTVQHAPILRRFLDYMGYPNDVTVTTTLEPWADDKFCSELHDWSYFKAIEELGSRDDWRPVYLMNPQYVEPGDIARSGSYRDRFGVPIWPDDPATWRAA